MAKTEPGVMSPTERRELRSIIKRDFEILKAELKVRRDELALSLTQAYQNDSDTQIKTIQKDLQKHLLKAKKEVMAARALGAEYEEMGYFITFGSGIRHDNVTQVTVIKRSVREDLQRLEAKLSNDYARAVIAVDRQSVDLQKEISIDALQSDAAKSFLERIPTVAELLPEPKAITV